MNHFIFEVGGVGQMRKKFLDNFRRRNKNHAWQHKAKNLLIILKNTRQPLKDMFRHNLCHLQFNENNQNRAIFIGNIDNMLSMLSKFIAN